MAAAVERRNDLEILNDAQLLKRYRIKCEGILFVVDLVRERITSPSVIGDFTVICQPLNSQTIIALSEPHIIRQSTRFPMDIRQQHRIKLEFMHISGMPSIIGAVGETHIWIFSPTQDEEVFVNRKKVHSINTQLVFDTEYNILDIVAKWPGSTPDSHFNGKQLMPII